PAPPINLASQKINPWNPEFHWSYVTGAKSYTVQVSETPFEDYKNNFEGGGDHPPYEDQVEDINQSTGFHFKADRDYYWRVIARGLNDTYVVWSNKGEGAKFTTYKPTVYGLSSPANNSPMNVSLKWKKTPGAARYKILVSRFPQLSPLIHPELETTEDH